METARLCDLTDAQLEAYRALMRWIRADGGDLEPWAPYLIAASPEGHLVRVLVGYAPPPGYCIIGPNCAQTAAVHRVHLRDGNQGVAQSVFDVPRYGMIRIDPDCYAQRFFVLDEVRTFTSADFYALVERRMR